MRAPLRIGQTQHVIQATPFKITRLYLWLTQRSTFARFAMAYRNIWNKKCNL